MSTATPPRSNPTAIQISGETVGALAGEPAD